MTLIRPFLVASLGVLCASPAWADKPAYCAAYARDFADARAVDKNMWQHKYDISYQSCIGEQKPLIARIPEPIKTKPVAKIVARVPEAKVEPVAAPAPAVRPSKPVPGSEDWNIYCANKYVSFDAKTGTYLSHTGVQRRCVASGFN
jgi:BA14K-like protein